MKWDKFICESQSILFFQMGLFPLWFYSVTKRLKRIKSLNFTKR